MRDLVDDFDVVLAHKPNCSPDWNERSCMQERVFLQI